MANGSPKPSPGNSRTELVEFILSVKDNDLWVVGDRSGSILDLWAF